MNGFIPVKLKKHLMRTWVYNKVGKSFQFDFQPIFKDLELAYCNLLRKKYLDQIQRHGQTGLIQSYELGPPQEPHSNINALHIYFRACLCEGIYLSNHFSEARTHWYHVYLRRPIFCNEVELSYCPNHRKVQARWKGC